MEEESLTYTDFSNSSPFEVLGARFEKLLTQILKNPSKYHHHSFEYLNNLELTIEFFNEGDTKDQTSSTCLFKPNGYEFDDAHPISQYYGIKKFLLITSNENYRDLDESDSRFILSSLLITLGNMKLNIPAFISIGAPSSNLFLGRFQTSKEMVNFRSELAKEIPSNLTNLDGMIDLLMAGIEKKKFQLLISSRYHFSIELPTVQRVFTLLKYGIDKPLRALFLTARWSNFDEKSEWIKSGFPLKQAQCWLNLIEAKSNGILSTQLGSILEKIREVKKEAKIDMISVFAPMEMGEIKYNSKVSKSIRLGSPFCNFLLDLLSDFSNLEEKWKAFVGELRKYWESGQEFMPFESPDWQYSILEQKIAMLNCCIKQSQNTKDRVESTNNTGWQIENLEDWGTGWEIDQEVPKENEEEEDDHVLSDHEEEDEEFFDIEESESILYLKNGDKMKIPETQPLPPTTEDMILSQQEIYEAMGGSKEGSDERQKVQSVTLLSDMQSFKNANPKCEFVDFLTWYSPRDVIDGEISTRMSTEGNIWLKCWNEAKPLTPNQQVPLFDHVREAELVLYYLESIPFGDLVKFVCGGVFTLAFITLLNTNVSHLTPILKMCESLRERINQSIHHINLEKYYDLCVEIEKFEHLISVCQTIKQIGFSDSIIMCCLEGKELNNFDYVLDSPFEREYLIRAVGTESTSQIYCYTTKKEFRIASAISQSFE